MREIPQLTDAEIREALHSSAPDATLLHRLRRPPSPHSPSALRLEALAEIERLRAEAARLRAIIQTIVARCDAVQADCEAGAPVSAYNVASGILGQIGSDK